MNYETWRKEKAIEFKKEIPRQTTINQEMYCLRRVFSEVAMTHGFISKDTIPDIPYIRLPKDQKHRRDDFTAKEWEELEFVLLRADKPLQQFGKNTFLAVGVCI